MIKTKEIMTDTTKMDIFSVVCMIAGGIGMYFQVPHAGWVFAIGVIAGLRMTFNGW